MALIGNIEHYNKNTDIEAYLERMEQLFACNMVDDKLKVPMLITLIGSEAYTVLKDLLAPVAPSSKSYNELVDLLKKQFSQKRLIVAERFKFYSANQETSESVKNFAVRLRNLANFCEFGQFLQEALRDKLVCGIKSDTIKRKLLTEENLTFDKALQTAMSMELTDGELKVMSTDGTSSSLNKVFGKDRNYRQIQPEKSQTNRTGKEKEYNTKWFDCRRCTRKHPPNYQCPAINWKCFACGTKGHTANSSWCNKKIHNISEESAESTNNPTMRENKSDESDEDFKLGILEMSIDHLEGNYVGNSLYVDVLIEGSILKMEVDTGACMSVMHIIDFLKLGSKNNLEKVNYNLKVVTGDNVTILGRVLVRVKLNNYVYNLPLVILDSNAKFVPLLGRNWLGIFNPDWKNQLLVSSPKCPEQRNYQKIEVNGANSSDLQLGRFISNLKSQKADLVQQLKVKFPKVFEVQANSCIENFLVSFKLKNNVKPVFHRAYEMPFALKPKVEEEINRLVRMGTLKKVNFSNWASPIVVVPRKGSNDIRICVDFKRTINQAIDTDQCTLPLPDDIYALLNGSKIFTEIDLSNAFQQLQINPECQELLTINTHLGLFQYTKMPFGISAAPGKFQVVMESILAGISNVKVYLDNIFIWSDSVDNCHAVVLEVMKQLARFNVKVNISKCKFYESGIEFLGHYIDANGLYPTKDKMDSINKAPAPKNLTQLKSYLGLLNYYRKFIPCLADKLKLLYDLCKIDVPFLWTEEHENCFQNSKKLLTDNNVLTYFNPNLPIFITCDASGYGVGAVLSHAVDKPILFVSSTLSQAERKYSNLEREALAIIFALKKFHKYIFGRKFTLITDHEPLKFIFGINKGIPAMAAARITRWAIILSAYDYKIEYKKGTLISNADGLSRLPIDGSSGICDGLFSFNLSEALPLNFTDIVCHTKKDILLEKIKDFTLRGWPRSVDEKLKPFFLRRHELNIENECLMVGTKVVIPSTLRQQILLLFHEDHLGMVRSKMLIRSYCWWPGVNNEIEKFIGNCEICNKFQNTSHKNYFSWPAATTNFFRVHIDFFHKSNYTFLIIVDQRSKFLDVKLMDNGTTAAETIIKLKEYFANFGLPTELVSDNGPPFSSVEFNRFCQANGINPVKSPPYHPQSNGMAERFVQTVKKSLEKSIFEHNDTSLNKNKILNRLYNFLFSYRNSPSTVTNQSPNDSVFKFKPRTRFDLIKPQYNETKIKPGKEKIIARKLFSLNDVVYVRNTHTKSWDKGKIIKILSYCTYLVLVNNIVKHMHFGDIRSCNNELTNENENDLSPESTMVSIGNTVNQDRSEPIKSSIVRNEFGTTDDTMTNPYNNQADEDEGDNTNRDKIPIIKVEENLDPNSDMKSSLPNLVDRYKTRSGRIIKRPDKLDL